MRKKKVRRRWANASITDNKWFRLPDGQVTLGCCDCGLVHNMWFRSKNGVIEMMLERNDKSTKALRAEQFRAYKIQNGYYRIRVLSYKKK